MASCAGCIVEDDEHILYQVGSESRGMLVLLGFGLRTIKQNSGRAGYASVGRQPAGSAGRRVSLLANRAEGLAPFFWFVIFLAIRRCCGCAVQKGLVTWLLRRDHGLAGRQGARG